MSTCRVSCYGIPYEIKNNSCDPPIPPHLSPIAYAHSVLYNFPGKNMLMNK